jgi:hypothetical protein
MERRQQQVVAARERRGTEVTAKGAAREGRRGSESERLKAVVLRGGCYYLHRPISSREGQIPSLYPVTLRGGSNLVTKRLLGNIGAKSTQVD